MGLDRTFTEFRQLQRYVGWRAEDAERVRSAASLVLGSADRLVDDFYAEIQRHADTTRVMTGGDRQVERLKGSLRAWLADFCSGEYGDAYVERRWRIGRRHVEIGLGQNMVNVAFSRLRQGIVRAVEEGWAGSAEELRETREAIGRLADLDLTVIQDAYETEYLSRVWPHDDATVRQHRVVSQISERALEDQEVRDLLDQAVILIAESFRANCCEVFEVEEGGESVLLRSAYGWSREKVGSFRVVIGAGSDAEFVLGIRRTVACEDTESERRFRSALIPESSGIKSSLWVRLSQDGDAFGILGVHFRQERLFSTSDADFLLSVANVLSTALGRKSAEDRRRAGEARLRRLVEGLPAGSIYVLGEAIFINSAIEGITGYDRQELARVEDWWRIVRPVKGGEPKPEPGLLANLEGRVRTQTALLTRRDGQERLIEITSFVSADDEVWLVHDITDAERLRQKSLQAERLAAIGQMITGLAHESRNALQRIRACTEMLEFDLEQNAQAMEMLGRIGKAQDDLQRLFDEVRGYAAPIKLERGQSKLASLVEEAWELTRPLWGERKVELAQGEGSQLELMEIDRFRLVQMFRNFFENSLGASTGPVRIEVTCHRCAVLGGFGVEIRVRDNGPGLTEEAKRQVFEPFFTTKTKGTGLGMAIAVRIADAHGGRLSVGEGTAPGAEFVIQLPQAVKS